LVKIKLLKLKEKSMGTPASGMEKIVTAFTNAQKRKFEYEKDQAALKGELLKMRAQQKAAQDLAGYQSKLRGDESQRQHLFENQNPSPYQQQRVATSQAQQMAAQRKQASDRIGLRESMDKLRQRRSIEAGTASSNVQKMHGAYVEPEDQTDVEKALGQNIPFKPDYSTVQVREDKKWSFKDSIHTINQGTQAKLNNIGTYEDLKKFIVGDLQQMIKSGDSSNAVATASAVKMLLDNMPPELLDEFLNDHIPQGVQDFMLKQGIFEEEEE